MHVRVHRKSDVAFKYLGRQCSEGTSQFPTTFSFVSPLPIEAAARITNERTTAISDYKLGGRRGHERAEIRPST